MNISEIFKNIRKAHGFSQAEFASKLGIGQGAISAIENGRVPNPGYDVLKSLIFEVGANPIYVFGIDNTVNPVMHPGTVKSRLSAENVTAKTKKLIDDLEKGLAALKVLKD